MSPIHVGAIESLPSKDNVTLDVPVILYFATDVHKIPREKHATVAVGCFVGK